MPSIRGCPIIPSMETGATDGRQLRGAGIPTYGMSGVFLDDLDDRAHGRDERVGVQRFLRRAGIQRPLDPGAVWTLTLGTVPGTRPAFAGADSPQARRFVAALCRRPPIQRHCARKFAFLTGSRPIRGNWEVPMKTEFLDVSDTRKQLVVEIPSTVVDAEIDRVARDYSKAARIPGFRPGKVPTKVVRQRFRDQILHDVAHDLIPRAVDDALRERGVEPVDTPDIRDVLVEEGQPLKFTANFETVPAFDPGDYGTPAAAQPPASVEDDAVEQALSGCVSAPPGTSRSRAAGRGRRHGRRRPRCASRAPSAPPTSTKTCRSRSARRRTRPASTTRSSA